MAELAKLFKEEQKRQGISLRTFAKAASVAYWQLRDHFNRQSEQQAKAKTEKRLKAQLKRLALKEPTYGYRRIHQEMLKKRWHVGEHKVRQILTELD